MDVLLFTLCAGCLIACAVIPLEGPMVIYTMLIILHGKDLSL